MRDDPLYFVFYLLMGAAWVGGGARILSFFGLCARDDVIERGNRAAAAAIAGALLGITLCFAGGNIGDGPGWWVVVFCAVLSTGVLLLFWSILDRATGMADTITIDHDGREVARGDLRTAEGRAAIEQFFATFSADDLRGPPKVLHAPGFSFSDVAAKVVSIINLASVADLENHVGATVDPLRFRGNLYVSGWPAWQELDMVVNISAVLSGDWGYVREDIRAVIDVAHGSGRQVKVIFENCYLDDAHKVRLCEICGELNADWVKTSTGYGSGGATAADVMLMRRHSPPHVQVKAAGGVRDLDALLQMRSLGVTRIGATRTKDILDECRRRLAEREG